MEAWSRVGWLGGEAGWDSTFLHSRGLLLQEGLDLTELSGLSFLLQV